MTAPKNAPPATAATTRTSSDQECDQCGWPYGPELHRVNVAGLSLVSRCRSPLACIARQDTLAERRERGLF